MGCLALCRSGACSKVPNDDWELVKISKSDNEKISFLRNKITNEHYETDSPAIVAFKAAVMASVGISVYLAGVTAFHVATLAMQVVKCVAFLFKNIFYDSCKYGLQKALYNVFDTLSNGLDDVAYKVRKLLTSPIFATLMQIGCLYTIIAPFSGRKIVANIERKWHDNISYKNDMRKVTDKGDDAKTNAYIFRSCFNNKAETVFYLAHCFQPKEKSKE